MDPLCADRLTMEEQLYLSSLSKHPGFLVLKKLMEDACSQASAKVVRVKPDDPERTAKISAYQAEAYSINSFCAAVLKSCGWHAMTGEALEEAQKIQQSLEDSEDVNGIGLGSIKMKPRKGR